MAKAVRSARVDAVTHGVSDSLLAAGALGIMGVGFAIVLVIAIVSAILERAAIEAAVPPPSDGTKTPDDRLEGFVPMQPGRHPSQPEGSAVMPAVPNDPWRRAHSRLQVATNLREAANEVLGVQADIVKARRRDKYLAALYTNERSKARTSIVRRELAVVLLLAVGGMIAVWGVR